MDRTYSGHEQFSSMPFGMLQALMFLNTKSKRVENLMKEAMKHSWQFERMPGFEASVGRLAHGHSQLCSHLTLSWNS